jgi:hypothetical protein
LSLRLARARRAPVNRVRGYADRRNFDKVEKWSRDGRRVQQLLFAGNSLGKAQRIFERFITSLS